MSSALIRLGRLDTSNQHCPSFESEQVVCLGCEDMVPSSAPDPAQALGTSTQRALHSTKLSWPEQDNATTFK